MVVREGLSEEVTFIRDRKYYKGSGTLKLGRGKEHFREWGTVWAEA